MTPIRVAFPFLEREDTFLFHPVPVPPTVATSTPGVLLTQPKIALL